MSRWSGLTNDTSTASMNPSFPALGRRESCIWVEQCHSSDLTCDAYIQDSFFAFTGKRYLQEKII